MSLQRLLGELRSERHECPIWVESSHFTRSAEGSAAAHRSPQSQNHSGTAERLILRVHLSGGSFNRRPSWFGLSGRVVTSCYVILEVPRTRLLSTSLMKKAQHRTCDCCTCRGQFALLFSALLTASHVVQGHRQVCFRTVINNRACPWFSFSRLKNDSPKYQERSASFKGLRA